MTVEEYLRAPDEQGLILRVDLGAPAFGGYRRLAGRAGPAPALAGVAAVVSPDGLVLWAGAVADRPLPFAAGSPPNVANLRDDARASASYRHRVLRVLADELRAELMPMAGRS
jgi:CO/xanthine dehydrogenase FAD-binding subunit